jgi:4-oxalomesaconate tautomerase
MVNSDTVAVATFPTPLSRVRYSGDTAISGVPGTAAEVSLRFKDVSGSATRSLLPTGNVRDVIDSVEVTCVDNGMPVVVAEASVFGLTGYERPEELAAMPGLIDTIQSLRLKAAELMGLGNVRESSVPKTTLIAPPRDGGMLCTRSFIPLRPHSSIGVFGALSVVTGVMLEGSVGRHLAKSWGGATRIDVEHPTGHMNVDVVFAPDEDGVPQIVESGFVRTARKLFDGVAYPRSGPR